MCIRHNSVYSFGPEYFFARRKKDNHPVPHAGRMRAIVRNAILHPDRLQAKGQAETAKASC